MKLSQLVQILNCSAPAQDVEFEGVSIDTRTLNPGDLFFAIQGENFDGHDFIEEASQQGAVAAIISHPVDSTLPTLLVEDCRKALGSYAAWHRQQFNCSVIALTGSSGKTTVKEMIASILAQNGNVCATRGNLNNDLGVPLTLLGLSSEHDYAVIELGANHLGEIAYTAELAQPVAALITNVGAAHVEGFGSVAGVAQAKAEIYQALPTDGIAIINADDSFATAWQELLTSQQIIRFGIENSADFSAKILANDEEGNIQCRFYTPLGEADVKLPVGGAHNVLNALAAAATSYAVGADLPDIITGLAQVQSVSGRLSLRPGLNGAKIIDDTYNANPCSVKVGLDYLAGFTGKRLFVFGDMGELGEHAADYHREIGEYAQTLAIEGVFTCGKLSEQTAQAYGNTAKHFVEQATLVKHLRPLLMDGVTCLVKGSRSAHMEDVVTALSLV